MVLRTGRRSRLTVHLILRTSHGQNRCETNEDKLREKSSDCTLHFISVTLSYFLDNSPQRHVGGQSIYTRGGQLHHAATVGAF